MLIQQLRELEKDGLIHRKVYPDFEWFMEKALLLKKIANQYNTD